MRGRADRLLEAFAQRLPRAERERLGAYRAQAMQRALLREIRKQAGETPAAVWLAGLNAAAASALFHALLLPVSEFFRDPAAFAALDAALPERPLRLLSAPCASGEEAWSLAALCRARPGRLGSRITGLDLLPEAIETARAARYPLSRLRRLHAARRRLLFDGEDFPAGEATISPLLRGFVDFRRQDLLAHFPPGPYDAILCRNLLIYLEPSAQHALIRAAARALAPGGLLLLGAAESAPGAAELGLAPGGAPKLYRKIARHLQE